MPASYRTSSVFTATVGTSVLVPVPSVQDGDMLVVALTTQSDAATVTAPGGWTAFTDSPVTDAPTGDSRLYCWWREASSEPASYTFTLSTATACSGGLVAYQDAGAIDQQEMLGVSAAATTAETATVTPSVDDTLVVCVFAADLTGSDEWTPRDPLTKRVDVAESTAWTRLAICDAPAVEMGLLYPDTVLYPSDVLYPTGGGSGEVFGIASLASSVPTMTAITSILPGVTVATTVGRRMLMGVGV